MEWKARKFQRQTVIHRRRKIMKTKREKTNYVELRTQFKNDLPTLDLELTGSKIPLF